MSTIISIILALQLMGGAFTQNNPENMDQNGWQFLEWGTHITEVQTLLAENGYTWTLKDKRIDLKKEKKQLESSLWFNESEDLIRVTGVRKFSLLEKKDADAYFQQLREDFDERFSPAVHEDDNTDRELFTLEWDMGKTYIVCRYDYKEKIIDEFGMDSYRIDVIFAPSKEDIDAVK